MQNLWSEEGLDRLARIVGDEHLARDPEELAQYRDPHWPADDESFAARAVVLPRTVDELAEVLRAANEYAAPIWTASLGKNWGYGAAAPREAGSVVVLLSRMNAILEIDPELAYAVVEPGVSWIALHEEMRRRGIDDLMLSIPEIGWGSIIGNTLDSGITFLPYGRDFRAMRGVEVMLSDGTLLRSGHGAVDGSRVWPLYPRAGSAPLQELFVQSNLGVVTKMAIGLMRRPQRVSSVYLSIRRSADLGRAVDVLRELCLRRIVEGVPTLNNLMGLRVQRPELLELIPDGALLDEATLEDIGEQSCLGAWGIRLGLWGDDAVVEHSLRQITELWAGIGDVRLLDDSEMPGEQYVHKLHQGIPNTDIVANLDPSYGQFSFTPVIPLRGSEVVETVAILEDFMRRRLSSNLSVSAFAVNERSIVVTANIKTRIREPEQFSRAREVLSELVELFGARGIGCYRTHLDAMDAAMEQYSFGGGSHRSTLERIKGALDENRILSPGRYGIR